MGILLASIGTLRPENEKPAIHDAAAQPKILIEAKWAEVSESSDWPAVISLLQKLREWGATEVFAADETTRAKAELITVQPGSGWQTNAWPESGIAGPYRVVLSPPQYARVMEELTRDLSATNGSPPGHWIQQGVDLLSAPRLTTVSGREAMITINNTRTIVTGVSTNQSAPRSDARYLSEPMEFGTTLHVVASALGNGSIHLGVEGKYREFLGYGEPPKGSQIEVWENGREKPGKVPLPILRQRIYATDTEIQDGEIVLLCGLEIRNRTRAKEKVPVLGSIPGLGRLFRSETEWTTRKHLLLFVKAERVKERENS